MNYSECKNCEIQSEEACTNCTQELRENLHIVDSLELELEDIDFSHIADISPTKIDADIDIEFDFEDSNILSY